MADVAARVGVSRALVSLVFRDVAGASQQTRDRVFRAAAEIGYQPDTAAQLLRRRRSGHLGVLYSPQHPFHADLIEALYPVADKSGYGVVLSALTSTHDETKAVEELVGFRSEVVILIGPTTTRAELSTLAARVPVVAVGRHVKGTDFDSVRTDDYQGARRAVEHLVGLGHREIVHIDGGSRAGSPDRRRAYRNTMRRHMLHEHIRVFPGDLTESSGARAAHEMSRHDRLPTAVVAANDRCAVGLLDKFLRLGVRVPEDVSVIGYDDSQLAQLSHIDLTTVRQDTAGMAEAMVQAATERLDEGRTEARHIVLEPSLVTRTTTGDLHSTL